MISIGLIPENRITVKSLISKIFVYSAIKIRANMLALYSVLNPETSSDSPSAKSNGVRFVSARFVINQTIVNGIMQNINHDLVDDEIYDMSIVCRIASALNIISAIDTSYEIVCATPRSAPRRAYLELEHHPDINVAYTFILDTHKKYRIPNEMNIDE